MELFKKLGRQVEQFKAEATDAAERHGNRNYRCEACGAGFDEHRDQCPDCGSNDVVPVDEGQ